MNPPTSSLLQENSIFSESLASEKFFSPKLWGTDSNGLQFLNDTFWKLFDICGSEPIQLTGTQFNPKRDKRKRLVFQNQHISGWFWLANIKTQLK